MYVSSGPDTVQGHRRNLLYPLLCLRLQTESQEEHTSELPKVIPLYCK